MKKHIVFLTLMVVLLTPVFTHAGPIIRSGESISVDATQVLKTDFYGLAPTVTISGTAEDDAYIGGGTVTINAPIQDDLTIIAGTAQIHGEIGDDLRVIAGEVTLAKPVKGDVVVLSGTLTILSTAQIEGDVLFMGGSLVVEGNVTGNIHGTADTVRINSEVGGDIMLGVASLFTLGDRAKVTGAITYESRSDLVRAQDAEVGGDIRKTEVSIDTGSGFLNMYLFELGTLLFTASALYLIARGRVRQVVYRSMQSPAISGLIGLGVFVVVPFIGIVLMVSLLGLFIGSLIFLLYLGFLVLSMALAGVLLGSYLEKIVMNTTALTFRTVCAGVFLFTLIGFIPYLGGLLMFASIVIVLGALSQTFYAVLRR